MIKTTSYSCFDLIDQRKHPPHPQKPDLHIGPVINVLSQDIYGVSLGGESNCALRKKFAALLVANPVLILPLRVVARLVCLIIGTWAKEAYKDVLLAWRIQRLECYKAGGLDQASGKATFIFYIFLHGVVYFTRDLIKLLTLPIATLLLELAALDGVLLPLDGRIFFSIIEDVWSLNMEISNGHLLQIINYQAPCMQPTRVAKKRNFWSVFQSYHPHTLRSLFRAIERSQCDLSPYFEGIDFAPLMLFRKHINVFSTQDRIEVSSNGELLEGEDSDDKAREILKKLQIELEKLVKNVDSIINSKINSNNLTMPENSGPTMIRNLQKKSKRRLGELKALVLKEIPKLNELSNE